MSVASWSPVISASPMTPELAGNALHLALGVRKHRLIVRRLLHLVGRPRPCQLLLKIVEIVGAHGAALATQHHESYRSIQLGYLVRR
jgi:hypothetical protein